MAKANVVSEPTQGTRAAVAELPPDTVQFIDFGREVAGVTVAIWPAAYPLDPVLICSRPLDAVH